MGWIRQYAVLREGERDGCISRFVVGGRMVYFYSICSCRLSCGTHRVPLAMCASSLN